MTRANCGTKLTSDLVPTNLLQELKHKSCGSGAMVLVSKKKLQMYYSKDKSIAMRKDIMLANVRRTMNDIDILQSFTNQKQTKLLCRLNVKYAGYSYGYA